MFQQFLILNVLLHTVQCASEVFFLYKMYWNALKHANILHQQRLYIVADIHNHFNNAVFSIFLVLVCLYFFILFLSFIQNRYELIFLFMFFTTPFLYDVFILSYNSFILIYMHNVFNISKKKFSFKLLYFILKYFSFHFPPQNDIDFNASCFLFSSASPFSDTVIFTLIRIRYQKDLHVLGVRCSKIHVFTKLLSVSLCFCESVILSAYLYVI